MLFQQQCLPTGMNTNNAVVALASTSLCARNASSVMMSSDMHKFSQRGSVLYVPLTLAANDAA